MAPTLVGHPTKINPQQGRRFAQQAPARVFMTDNTSSNGDGQSYPVGTIWEMAAIPEEARGRFLAELPLILSEAAKVVEIYAGFNQAFEGIGEVALQTPEWIDDDKNELHHTLAVADGPELSITKKRSQGTPA